MNISLDTNLLLHQLRDANQRLVLTTVHAQELAEVAEAAREKLAASELRTRLLMDNLAATVWSADAGGHVRFVPSPWLASTRLEPGEREEWQWLEGVHPDDRERVRTTWSEAVRQGKPYSCEHRLRLRDGGVAWVQSRAVAVPRGVVPVREWSGMMADISDRKRVEAARERFISVLAHDLRSPLSAIDMSAQFLGSLALGDEARPLVNVIERCTRRMNRMITDVLDFARGRLGGGIPIVRKPADFAQICTSSLAELRAGHPDRTIELEADGGLTGRWDVDRVEQVITNLVGNALAYGADPIRVVVRAAGDDVVMQIHNQNRGRPMSPELLPRLFEPFRRGESPGNGLGLGLGLYIVSEILTAHGGRIEVASTAEAGTCFTSTWPRHLDRGAS